MCNCIKDIESKTRQHLEKAIKEKGWEMQPAQYSDGLQNVAILFSKREGSIQPSPSQLHTTFTFSYTKKKKDGTYTKAKKHSQNMMFNNCPFCGESYNNEGKDK